jgi:hypothetical protein
MHRASIGLAEGYGLTTDRQEMTPAPIRIDVRRGLKALLLTLVIPTSIAVLVDVTTGMSPWLTIAVVIICIPLATIVVNRTILAEFDRVVGAVAPVETVETEEVTGQAAMALPLEPAGSDSISNDWPLDGQSLTEGAQKHHA